MCDSQTAVTEICDASTSITNTCDPPIAVTELTNTIIDNFREYRENLYDTNQYSPSLTEYLQSIRHDSDFNLMIETLNTCYCCERHQKDKPTKLEKYFETPLQNGGQETYPCNCKCRQLSRFICRAQYGVCYKSD